MNQKQPASQPAVLKFFNEVLSSKVRKIVVICANITFFGMLHKCFNMLYNMFSHFFTINNI